jgi:hypothetical protein
MRKIRESRLLEKENLLLHTVEGTIHLQSDKSVHKATVLRPYTQALFQALLQALPAKLHLEISNILRCL